MKQAIFQSLLLICAMVGSAGSAYAQQAAAPNAQSTPPAATPANPAVPVAADAPAAPAAATQPAPVIHAEFVAPPLPPAPSADVLKKARQAGYHTKLKNGIYAFCKEQADTGTRFSTEKCIDGNTLAQTLLQQQAQRDQMRSTACSGSACSGK
jgi:hypothetical protein